MKLNSHVVGFVIGCHEALLLCHEYIRVFNYSGTNWVCH